VQCDEVLTVNAKQHARSALRRQVRPNFPKTASHRAAQRHSYRPTPLRPQQVLAYRLSFFFRQLLQPFPYRLASRPRAEEDQRDFLRLRIVRDLVYRT
jgi:hypothetical protein